MISGRARRSHLLLLSHSLALSLAHGHRSVRDSHGEVEKRLFSLLFLNSEIRIDDTIHISPHTTLFPMRSETESRFSQVLYGALFPPPGLGVMGVCGSGGRESEMKCTVAFFAARVRILCEVERALIKLSRSVYRRVLE